MSESPSTRKRTSPQSQNRSASNASDKSSLNTSNNLPPPRTSSSLRKVSPPLSSTRLNRLIYLLVGLTTLLCAFYTYRLLQYKNEVGGWWSVAMGRPQDAYAQSGDANVKPPKTTRWAKGRETEVEDRINALAEALGMPSNELASAIAGAVRAYVAPASLSSVAARETGEAVNVLLSEPTEGGEAPGDAKATHGVVDGILQGVESFAGMDEP